MIITNSKFIAQDSPNVFFIFHVENKVFIVTKKLIELKKLKPLCKTINRLLITWRQFLETFAKLAKNNFLQLNIIENQYFLKY